MSEFISDFFNNHLKSISYDDSLVSSKSADEKKSMPSIFGKYIATATITIEQFDRILEIFPKIKPIYRKIETGSTMKKEKMSEFIALVIKTITETVTDLTEQQRSEIKYALEQAIELYNKDINGIKNKLNQNDKEIENASLP